jgi:hypothetical protein
VQLLDLQEKPLLVAVAKPEGFRLLTGEGEMTEYLFNTKKNQHFFASIAVSVRSVWQ